MTGRYQQFQEYLARETAVFYLLEIQGMLDQLYDVAPNEERDKARETFGLTLRKLNALMDGAINAVKAPGMKDICDKCGRQGHSIERCTFKNHI